MTDTLETATTLTTERRSYDLGRVEIREKSGEIHFSGHAAVFNSNSRPIGPTKYIERVMPGAFTRSLATGQDVLFTINHDPDKLLARTSSGTLKLHEDAKGLAVKATFPDTSYARDAAELMSRGDLNAMSFVFKPQSIDWGSDNGIKQRNLKDVDLFDVSIVTMPAYPETDVDMELRSFFDALTEARAGKMISAANKDVLQNIIDTLNQLIADESDTNGPDPRSLTLDLIERYGISDGLRSFRA